MMTIKGGGRDHLQVSPVRKPRLGAPISGEQRLTAEPLVQLTGGVRSSARLRARSYAARLASAQEAGIAPSARTACQVSLVQEDARMRAQGSPRGMLSWHQRWRGGGLSVPADPGLCFQRVCLLVGVHLGPHLL